MVHQANKSSLDQFKLTQSSNSLSSRIYFKQFIHCVVFNVLFTDTAWFVEKVIIKEGVEAYMEYLFRVNEWIEPHDPEDQHYTPKEIPLAG